MAMKNRPTVLVSMRLAPATNYREERDAISHDWLTFLARFDLTLIFAPNNSAVTSILLRELNPSHVLLTGGDNVAATSAQSGSVRDEVERQILDYAVGNNARVFGTCRGLQFTNVYFGGAVTKDLKAAIPGEMHVGERHRIVLPDTDQTETVNSFHDQGVMRHQVAAALHPFAFSEQGVVEAVRHRDRPILAVQWHPERDGSAEKLDRELLRAWLQDDR